jgi:hypothetical protein
MYHEGDLVKVTINNFKITDSMGSSSLRGTNDDMQWSSRSSRKSDEIYLSIYNDITVEKIASADDFKPRVGDVYRTYDGDIYYVRKYKGYSGTVVIENGKGRSYSDDKYNLSSEIEDFKKKSPKLIVRDGQEVT